MADTKTNKTYGLPLPTLLDASQRLEAAFKDDTVGAPVAAHFPPSYLTDYSAQVAAVAKAMEDQSNAKGSVGSLVKDQGAALRIYEEQAATARTAAKLAFPDDVVLLHNAFQVGERTSRSIAAIKARADRLLAGCREHAEALAAHGWSEEANTALIATTDAFKSAHVDQHLASDEKEGLTAQKADVGNRLYQMCRAIQAVARRVYPKSKQAADPRTAENRAKFLLGEFPPRRKRPAEDPQTPAASGTTPPAPALSPSNGATP